MGYDVKGKMFLKLKDVNVIPELKIHILHDTGKDRRLIFYTPSQSLGYFCV